MRFAKHLLAALALGSMVALPAHAELDVASLKQSIETSFESEYPKLDALYKDIHAHPELAFQEEKTAAKLAAEMRAIGFEVTEKVGRTGLVALFRNGDGPTIMVRTELDALPMEEKTGLAGMRALDPELPWLMGPRARGKVRPPSTCHAPGTAAGLSAPNRGSLVRGHQR